MLIKTWGEIQIFFFKKGDTQKQAKLAWGGDILALISKYLVIYYKFQNGLLHAPAGENSTLPIFKTSITIKSDYLLLFRPS